MNMFAQLLRPADRPRPHDPRNPWGLSPGQVAVLVRIVDHGEREKCAALALDCSVKTVTKQLERVRKKMQVETTIQAAIVWDRARRVTA